MVEELSSGYGHDRPHRGRKFAIVASSLVKPADVMTVAEKILKGLSTPFVVDHHKCTIGASIGIALCPNDSSDGPTLMKQAEIALYRAKRQGRNRFVEYDEDLDASLHHRVMLENDLREALGRRPRSRCTASWPKSI